MSVLRKTSLKLVNICEIAQIKKKYIQLFN